MSERPTAAPGTVAKATRIAQFANTLTGFVGTDDGELLVADRLGAIWRLHPRGDRVPELEPTPVLDLTPKVSATPGERGFFNLTLTPDGTSIVVDYTATDGTITVERYPYRPGSPIDATSASTLLSLPDPYAWHHGGGLAFDRHGNLLVGIGDMEFRQFDPPGPQDPALMLGGVLRISKDRVDDPDGSAPPGPEDMIARGLRNPWRLTVDAAGDLWIGDVGLDTYEEVNHIRAAEIDDPTITNFGWPYREGPDAQQRGAPEGFDPVEPLLARRHGEGTCGIVGGLWYRGDRVDALSDRYVYGDLCGTSLRSFALGPDDKPVGDGAIADLPETITSIGEDADHELWALGAQGGLYRIDPVAASAAGSDQSPPEQGTTTSIERTSDDCAGGVVEAMLPLSDAGGLDPDQLIAAFAAASTRLDTVVPTLPEATKADGELVQRMLHQMLAELDAHPDARDRLLTELRGQLMTGTGPYEGFPEAMARIVDSECG